MARKSFYIVLFNCLLWALPIAAQNRAALDLAARLYRIGNGHLQTRQWEKALRAYRPTVLLDGAFAEVVEKKHRRIPAERPTGESKNPPPETTIPSSFQMLQIKNHLENGERAEAVLALTELLREEPQNKRARLLLEKLQNDEAAISPESPKFKEAERLYKEGVRVQGPDQLLAYRRYQQALGLFAGLDLKPYFYKELTDRSEAVAEALLAELEPRLVQLEAMEVEKRGAPLRAFAAQYPPSPHLQKMLGDLYEELQTKALPILLSARTLQALEGCRASADKFAKVQSIALFPEVPAWQEAQRNIEACVVTTK